MNTIIKLGRSLVIAFKNIGKDPSKRFKKEYVCHLFRLFTHPIDTFNDLKYEGKSSVTLANILIGIWFLETVISTGMTGYLFAGAPQSPVMALATTAGFALLWCICNWSACTLFDGEGTFKEIWIVTAYSLLPMLIFEPFVIIFSNIASTDEAVLVSTIHTLGLIWTLILEFLGMMVCHQFTVTKTLLLAIVSIAGIFVIAFIALIFFSISQQFVDFISSIWTEIIL